MTIVDARLHAGISSATSTSGRAAVLGGTATGVYGLVINT